MYAVNIERHVPAGPPDSVFQHAFDVDEHYVSEMKDRALVLAEDPLRCQSLPHMTLAGWDLLELIMESKARDYPEWFELHRDGDRWRWINRPLGIDDRFTFLDESTLPTGRWSTSPPGAGRLHAPGPARGHALDRGRHGDHPGRLEPRLRHRHEVPRMARPVPMAHEMGSSTGR
jgi:hypothetical protein